MMVMADRVAFLEVFWGAISIGAVPVPVSTMLAAKDYEFLLRDSRAVAVVASDVFAPGVLPATDGQPHLRHVLVEGAPAVDPRALPYHQLRDAVGGCELFPADDEDVAFWLYTSGTTGFPKAAIHRHADMAFLTDRFARELMQVTETDRMYAVPKLFFAYGLGVHHFALGCGASQVLFDGRPTVEAVVDHVTRHRPTLFWGIPTFLAQLLSSDTPADSFASVRAAVTGGETLPDDIRRRCLERFGMVALDAIGSTEVGHIYICNRLDRQHPGSVGWPVPGFEVELRDLDDAPVPDGEPGRLFVAGESITLGYWRRTERNRTAFHGRYFDTGDTFVRNDDGSYTYLGRGDDMIKAGGIWVSPTEVEAAIIELPEVALAAVVGVPDADGLEKPKAFVVLEAGVEGSDELVARIQQHVKRTLAPFKYPRWVEFRDELPLTATGKLRRHVLRDEARARR
jgi:benzoate-CoA ligase